MLWIGISEFGLDILEKQEERIRAENMRIIYENM